MAQPPRITRREALLMGAGAAALPLSACGADFVQNAGDNTADLIIENANIWTQDPSLPEAKSVAVKGGRIMKVEPSARSTAAKHQGTRTIDAGGRRLIPGLNDSHMHPTRGGRFYAAELRWDGVTSLQRGLDMIREAAQHTPADQWVRVVGGWSPFQFVERRMPTPQELSEAAPDTPVFVLYLYSRGYLNRAGVKALGLTPQVQTPPMTRYEFTPDGGVIIHAEPNPDLLYGTIGKLPPLSAEDQISSTRHFYRELNRFGLTSIIDAGGGGHRFPDNYIATDAIGEDRDLSIRISNYLFPQDKGGELQEFQRWTSDYQVQADLIHGLTHRYIVRGAGEFLVWSAGDFENFLWEAPEITTRDLWRPQLMTVTRHLLKNRWPIRIHATYDESMNHILGVFEDAHRLEVEDGRPGFTGLRWAIDHAETARDETLARVKRLGGGLAVQSRMAYAGEYFLERYGPERTRRSPPLRSMLNAGLSFGLGSDATRVASYNPWNTLSWATTGRSVGGTELLGPEQRLSRQEALFAHTVGSAWFSQEEHLKGRIAPGQFADLAMLSADYFTEPSADLPYIESILTIMDGSVVFARDQYHDLLKPLPPLSVDWSPVHHFGGYARQRTVL